MVENKIRNGGFERGDVEFWDAFVNTSFAADAAIVYAGNYSGKLFATAAGQPYIMSSDYIKMVEGDAFIFSGYANPNTWYSITPQVLYFDEGLALIETRDMIPTTLGVDQWTYMMDIITHVRGAEYIKIKLMQTNTGIDQYTCFDNLSLRRTSPMAVIGNVVELFDLADMEGADTATSTPYPVLQFREAIFRVNAYTLAQAAATLDVKIQSYDRPNAEWFDIATFEQITTAPGQLTVVVTAGLGELIRVYYDHVGAGGLIGARTTGIFKR